MTKPARFRFLGDYPHVDSLIEDVDSLGDAEWTYFTYRQKTIVGHRDTETVPLLFDWKRRTRHIEHRNFPRFAKHLDALSSLLREFNEPHIVKRANLVKLKAQSEIAPHVDKGEFLSSLNRLHIPIKTNDDCFFIVGSEMQRFRIGSIWEINNTDEVHSVHNNGSTDRIHLIIDVGTTPTSIQ